MARVHRGRRILRISGLTASIAEPLLIALDLEGLRGVKRLGLLERRDGAVARPDRDRVDQGAGALQRALFAGPV